MIRIQNKLGKHWNWKTVDKRRKGTKGSIDQAVNQPITNQSMNQSSIAQLVINKQSINKSIQQTLINQPIHE